MRHKRNLNFINLMISFYVIVLQVVNNVFCENIDIIDCPVTETYAGGVRQSAEIFKKKLAFDPIDQNSTVIYYKIDTNLDSYNISFMIFNEVKNITQSIQEEGEISDGNKFQPISGKCFYDNHTLVYGKSETGYQVTHYFDNYTIKIYDLKMEFLENIEILDENLKIFLKPVITMRTRAFLFKAKATNYDKVKEYRYHETENGYHLLYSAKDHEKPVIMEEYKTYDADIVGVYKCPNIIDGNLYFKIVPYLLNATKFQSTTIVVTNETATTPKSIINGEDSTDIINQPITPLPIINNNLNISITLPDNTTETPKINLLHTKTAMELLAPNAPIEMQNNTTELPIIRLLNRTATTQFPIITQVNRHRQISAGLRSTLSTSKTSTEFPNIKTDDYTTTNLTSIDRNGKFPKPSNEVSNVTGTTSYPLRSKTQVEKRLQSIERHLQNVTTTEIPSSLPTTVLSSSTTTTTQSSRKTTVQEEIQLQSAEMKSETASTKEYTSIMLPNVISNGTPTESQPLTSTIQDERRLESTGRLVQTVSTTESTSSMSQKVLSNATTTTSLPLTSKIPDGRRLKPTDRLSQTLSTTESTSTFTPNVLSNGTTTTSLPISSTTSQPLASTIQNRRRLESTGRLLQTVSTTESTSSMSQKVLLNATTTASLPFLSTVPYGRRLKPTDRLSQTLSTAETTSTITPNVLSNSTTHTSLPISSTIHDERRIQSTETSQTVSTTEPTLTIRPNLLSNGTTTPQPLKSTIQDERRPQSTETLIETVSTQMSTSSMPSYVLSNETTTPSLPISSIIQDERRLKSTETTSQTSSNTESTSTKPPNVLSNGTTATPQPLQSMIQDGRRLQSTESILPMPPKNLSNGTKTTSQTSEESAQSISTTESTLSISSNVLSNSKTTPPLPISTPIHYERHLKSTETSQMASTTESASTVPPNNLTNEITNKLQPLNLKIQNESLSETISTTESTLSMPQKVLSNGMTTTTLPSTSTSENRKQQQSTGKSPTTVPTTESSLIMQSNEISSKAPQTSSAKPSNNESVVSEDRFLNQPGKLLHQVENETKTITHQSQMVIGLNEMQSAPNQAGESLTIENSTPTSTTIADMTIKSSIRNKTTTRSDKIVEKNSDTVQVHSTTSLSSLIMITTESSLQLPTNPIAVSHLDINSSSSVTETPNTTGMQLKLTNLETLATTSPKLSSQDKNSLLISSSTPKTTTHSKKSSLDSANLTTTSAADETTINGVELEKDVNTITSLAENSNLSNTTITSIPSPLETTKITTSKSTTTEKLKSSSSGRINEINEPKLVIEAKPIPMIILNNSKSRTINQSATTTSTAETFTGGISTTTTTPFETEVVTQSASTTKRTSTAIQAFIEKIINLSISDAKNKIPAAVIDEITTEEVSEVIETTTTTTLDEHNRRDRMCSMYRSTGPKNFQNWFWCYFGVKWVPPR